MDLEFVLCAEIRDGGEYDDEECGEQCALSRDGKIILGDLLTGGGYVCPHGVLPQG